LNNHIRADHPLISILPPNWCTSSTTQSWSSSYGL